MIYKTLLKVSNVCQLLDKSKFATTGTLNGVTFHNNGDGSYTLNGTSTDYIYFNFYKLDKKLRAGVRPGVILSKGYYGEDCWYDINNDLVFYLIGPGETVNNRIIRPQLFDLTEMYGAGHEPTTVEQFRQDFPDEMYDYKPYCWLTSYKRVFMTKTKNLLNPNTCNIYQSVAFGMNIELIDNNQTVHVYGTSTDTGAYASFNVIKTSDKSIYNKGYKIKFFNLAGKNPPVIRNIYGLRELDTFGQIAITVDITEGVYYDFSFRIMVSEQTATDYVPYGTIPSYKKSLVCKTKNLLDIDSYFNVVNSNIIINGNSILCVATNKNAHVFYKIPTVIGEKYTVSNKSIVRKIPAQAANYGIFISDNNNNDSSNYLPMGLMSGQSFTFTARTEFLYVHWYITYSFSVDNPNSIEVNELQVERGDTATDYVPYGHL